MGCACIRKKATVQVKVNMEPKNDIQRLSGISIFVNEKTNEINKRKVNNLIINNINSNCNNEINFESYYVSSHFNKNNDLSSSSKIQEKSKLGNSTNSNNIHNIKAKSRNKNIYDFNSREFTNTSNYITPKPSDEDFLGFNKKYNLELINDEELNKSQKYSRKRDFSKQVELNYKKKCTTKIYTSNFKIHNMEEKKEHQLLKELPTLSKNEDNQKLF